MYLKPTNFYRVVEECGLIHYLNVSTMSDCMLTQDPQMRIPSERLQILED